MELTISTKTASFKPPKNVSIYSRTGNIKSVGKKASEKTKYFEGEVFSVTYNDKLGTYSEKMEEIDKNSTITRRDQWNTRNRTCNCDYIKDIDKFTTQQIEPWVVEIYRTNKPNEFWVFTALGTITCICGKVYYFDDPDIFNQRLSDQDESLMIWYYEHSRAKTDPGDKKNMLFIGTPSSKTFAIVKTGPLNLRLPRNRVIKSIEDKKKKIRDNLNRFVTLFLVPKELTKVTLEQKVGELLRLGEKFLIEEKLNGCRGYVVYNVEDKSVKCYSHAGLEAYQPHIDGDIVKLSEKVMGFTKDYINVINLTIEEASKRTPVDMRNTEKFVANELGRNRKMPEWNPDEIIYDGEFYIEGASRNDISGKFRLKKESYDKKVSNPDFDEEKDPLINFHVFDYFCPLKQLSRSRLLRKHVYDCKYVKPISNYLETPTIEETKEMWKKIGEKGGEGVVLKRDMALPKKTNSSFKFKFEFDENFMCVDHNWQYYKKKDGSEIPKCVLTFQLVSGKKFNALYQMSDNALVKLKSQDDNNNVTISGKMYNIVYKERGEDGIPFMIKEISPP